MYVTKLNDTHHKELNSINNISNVLRLTKTSGNISISVGKRAVKFKTVFLLSRNVCFFFSL